MVSGPFDPTMKSSSSSPYKESFPFSASRWSVPWLPISTSFQLELSTLTVGDPKEVMERWYPNGTLGGLTLDGTPPGVLGTVCLLEVRTTQPAERHFNVQGQIAWIRHKGTKTLRECYGVDFLASDEGRYFCGQTLHPNGGEIMP